MAVRTFAIALRVRSARPQSRSGGTRGRIRAFSGAALSPARTSADLQAGRAIAIPSVRPSHAGDLEAAAKYKCEDAVPQARQGEAERSAGRNGVGPAVANRVNPGKPADRGGEPLAKAAELRWRLHVAHEATRSTAEIPAVSQRFVIALSNGPRPFSGLATEATQPLLCGITVPREPSTREMSRVLAVVSGEPWQASKVLGRQPMTAKSKNWQTLCKILFAIAFVNFGIYWLAAVYLGGDALSGGIRNGRYFLMNHGAYREVSEAVFNYSKWHARSIWITHPMAFAAVAFLLHLRREKNAADT